MVSPAKIFRIVEDADLGFIARKLKDYRKVEPYESGDREGELITEFTDLEAKDGRLNGTFSRDTLTTIYHRGGSIEVPQTRETQIIFKKHRDNVFLIILEEKPRANRIANRISEALFLKTGSIVEGKIGEETLKEMHESNPRATKVIYFDDVDIPDVGKLALYGSSLADTSLYQEYLDHGKVWYVVFKVEKRGIVIGITRNCVLVLFSKLTQDEFVDYILEDVLPLVSLGE
ncbi:hypothetical protein AKJ43_01795 [candidate division MSBL1 archaeon SCGC-AAA261D19]|uniref:Uncharacterized protein n=1 Tax=candidate division MSBL1 archaeon SCGC-AAA261D19 TaxID=1698273 RepID=A0A133V7G9_9EURY|nr:hypothetical protein AKJ43_01795 [candidate division MSBL1 archaeon SCGC-AAA261D19]